MNLGLILFSQSLRARLAGKTVWLLAAFLPLLIGGAARLLPPQEVSTPVQVGVVLPEAGGEDFWQRLEKRSGLVVTFHRADRARAERQVAAGQWDCALVLPPDFETRLKQSSVEELFTLLIGPGSAVYPMVRETVSACVAEAISPGMAEDYLLDSGIADAGALDGLRPRLHEVLLDQDRVLVSMETADGRPLDPLVLADSGVSRLLTGLTAIVLLIWVILTAMDLGRWLDSPAVRRLVPLRGRVALLLPRLGAELLPIFCSGALALLAVENCCILALAPYLLFWGGVALVLALHRPLWISLPSLMPFVPVLGILLSPVLLDLSLIFPALGPLVRWNPLTLCLRACGGSWQDGLLLAGAGGAMLVLAALPDRIRT